MGALKENVRKGLDHFPPVRDTYSDGLVLLKNNTMTFFFPKMAAADVVAVVQKRLRSGCPWTMTTVPSKSGGFYALTVTEPLSDGTGKLTSSTERPPT